MLSRASATYRHLRGAAFPASSRIASVLSDSPPLAIFMNNMRATTVCGSRTLCSYAGAGSTIQRAYPQYSIFGESSMLSLKIIMPNFRMVNNSSIAIDNKNRGKMLFEFVPRVVGQYLWSEKSRFALSPEEAGLFCSQLPQFGIELSRNPAAAMQDDFGGGASVSNDMPDKVLRITPGEGASVSFELDYVRDGVGGQSPGIGQDGVGPMQVVAQAGEFEVIRSIVQSSLPALVGWQPLLDISVQTAIKEAQSGGSGGGGGRYSGGGTVPF